MTTPPATPETPVTMPEAIAWIEQLGHDSGTEARRDACYMLAKAARQTSPQESHKLAEELEWLALDFAARGVQSHETIHINARIRGFVERNLNAILAALRSSQNDKP